MGTPSIGGQRLLRYASTPEDLAPALPQPVTETRDAAFDRAIAEHDRAIAARGLEIWIGNEPTFTDRASQEPQWLWDALGAEKHRHAETLLAGFAQPEPGAVVLRTLGRQYPGEAAPRWCLGLYARRDDTPMWSGPPDPLLAPPGPLPNLDALQARLATELGQRGYAHHLFYDAYDRRIVFGTGSTSALPDPDSDQRLWRASIHHQAIPPGGLQDDLADAGIYLLILSGELLAGRPVVCLELPALPNVTLFADLLAAISASACAGGVPSLVLRGHPPPVDDSVRWTTLTPDPAVVEVNMAPCPTVSEFLRDNRRWFEAAAAHGLSPYRLYYNGTVADSGGGGQITLGGPTPHRSPFLLVPALLPRLVRYMTRHPSLSYLFAHDYVGPSGQSVRPDERGADTLVELQLALALLAHDAKVEPATLWRSLAPHLADASGNSHRAEINVEKLWNPHQPGRGQLGLVEFRAFRMQHTPVRAAALAALMRAIVAMLATRDDDGELVEWGAALHERFALPFYLEHDLCEVLADLEADGLGLAPALAAELQADHWRHCHTIEFGDCRLTLRRALEFWPLLGDTANHRGDSRTVDASTSRLEITLRADSTAALDAWQLRANDIELPLRGERDGLGPARVFGLRYRSFVPIDGLHPTLPAQSPLRLVLSHPMLPDALEITWHEWRADGTAYDGLPRDLAEAAARRAGRCVPRRCARELLAPARTAAPRALTPYTLDLRFPSDTR